jgi:NADPH:quinone reductase-like Zn-dependent oxidoreductase
MLGRLRNGDSALVHGGGGGVNTAALHLCRFLAPECKVFVTASAAKITRVEELGAFLAIDYRRENFAEIIRKATAKRGVDVILEATICIRIWRPWRSAGGS